MNSYKDIQGAINDRASHVFLITSPVVAIMARLVIDSYKIPLDKVICVPFRKSSTSLVGGEILFVNKYFIDRIYQKLFYNSLFGKRIEKIIRKKGDNFLLYAAWDYPEMEEVLNSKLCLGHVYLEEGQMSYGLHATYHSTSSNFLQKNRLKSLRNHRRLRSKECDQDGFTEYYRHNAIAFIGMLPEAFPAAPKDRRVILSNYNDIVNNYKPKLKGIKTIGLMCAPRRLHSDQWKDALQILVDRLPNGGAIKLHPGFSENEDMRNKIALALSRISSDSIVLCDDDIILEAEMLFEPKFLIGSLTSLSLYATAFGSKFENIELY
jgi:hypothetical protein